MTVLAILESQGDTGATMPKSINHTQARNGDIPSAPLKQALAQQSAPTDPILEQRLEAPRGISATYGTPNPRTGNGRPTSQSIEKECLFGLPITSYVELSLWPGY